MSCKVVRFSTDEASIQLADPTTGELFAECPVSLPLQTCCEPVIDSSRYFVIRVVEGRESEGGRHAFIGLGFREREEASDFNAALSEHQQYLERKAAAVKMRKAFDDACRGEGKQQQGGGLPSSSSLDNTMGVSSSSDGSTSAPSSSPSDYSLQPGEKLHLRLGSGRTGGSFVSSRGKLTKTFSLIFDPDNGGAAKAALAPPPPSRRVSREQDEHPVMGVSPKSGADGRRKGNGVGDGAWGEFASAD